MRRFLSIAIISGVALACSSPPSPNPSQSKSQAGCPESLHEHLGKTITLVGVQARSKIPTLCGVDIDGDDAYADKSVRATGRLEEYTVVIRGADAPIVASRGPGTYYRLVRAKDAQLAKTSLAD